MTGGFDANVPARKPRTRIGRVLTELSSESDEQRDEATVSASRKTMNGAEATTTRGAGDGSDASVPERITRHEPAEARPDAAEEKTRLLTGRERVASLRERLAQAARPPVTAAEPRRAAAAVLEVVQDLRERLDSAMQERADMARAMDDMRTELGRTRADVEKERKLRTAVEAQADERARIAAEAVAEAEALASERDQVLSELAEQRRLDDEQAGLLAEAEALLERRDEERVAAARETAELRDAVDARAVQLDEMESRLRAGAEDYARLEARCRELEAQVAELTEVREALEALQATVHRRST